MTFVSVLDLCCSPLFGPCLFVHEMRVPNVVCRGYGLPPVWGARRLQVVMALLTVLTHAGSGEADHPLLVQAALQSVPES